MPPVDNEMLGMASSLQCICSSCSGHITASDLFPARALTFSHSEVIPCLMAVSISYYFGAAALEFSMSRAALIDVLHE